MNARFLAATALAITSLYAMAQQGPRLATMTGHVAKAERLAPEDARAKLVVGPGFEVSTFATGLGKPRILAVASDGTVYATRRDAGDVIMLRDGNGDGKADPPVIVARRPQMHGIALDGSKVYLVTVKELFVTDRKSDGTFGPLQRLIDDLPDAGQHADRTIAIGPDGMLYLSVGSTCNACDETNPENATMLRIKPDGSSRTVYASGLRNTIGFAFNPKTKALFGFDHGIDWLGDDDQGEELNEIVKDHQYGWPYIYADHKRNPQDEPPGEITMEQWDRMSTPPVLLQTAHAAPMQMAFYQGTQFPSEFQGDAFVAFHGSWNRKVPSGYEVARVRFQQGKPVKIETFLNGFLVNLGSERWGTIGRPFGLAITPDGSLLVGDDLNGVIYRVRVKGAKGTKL
jgi:glucose/arabinose dehydrogenase